MLASISCLYVLESVSLLTSYYWIHATRDRVFLPGNIVWLTSYTLVFASLASKTLVYFIFNKMFRQEFKRAIVYSVSR